MTEAVCGAVSFVTSPPCSWSRKPNRRGKLSQNLKHMRQPLQTSKTRSTSFCRRPRSQYFASSGS